MVCYGFGKVESNQYSSYPSFERDLQDKGGLDVKKVRWEGVEIKENNETYVLNPNTNDVYYYDSYIIKIVTDISIISIKIYLISKIIWNCTY